jgi:mRNA interferase MazF
VTSQQPRNQFDVVLEHWKEAGLLKPSVARTSKITSSVHGSELKRCLGKLHNHDLEQILGMCVKLFQ